MTDTKTREALRELAEAANKIDDEYDSYHDWQKCYESFQAAADPATIITLLDDLERKDKILARSLAQMRTQRRIDRAEFPSESEIEITLELKL